MSVKLSNIWEKLDETISYMVEPKLKQKYLLLYNISTGKLRITELEFLKNIVNDFKKVVTFRFLFDYDPKIKRNLLLIIQTDPDSIINALMVELNGQENIHGIIFQGADEICDVERYRELDERIKLFIKGSSFTEDIEWLTDWITAFQDESDKPDINALKQIYRKFLKTTGYNIDYGMLDPKELLLEIRESNK